MSVKRPYTVLVGRPDYMVRDNPLTEIFHAHVQAKSVKEAEELGIKEAADNDDLFPVDYLIVAVYEGHLQNIATGDR